jgi:hypothetical protein
MTEISIGQHERGQHLTTVGTINFRPKDGILQDRVHHGGQISVGTLHVVTSGPIITGFESGRYNLSEVILSILSREFYLGQRYNTVLQSSCLTYA